MTCDRPVHILLYGPPAVGKKTVGQALSAMSGYPLIDNHLTGDIGRRIFPGSALACAELVDNLRIEIARAAAAARVNLIATWMFDPAVDRPIADRLATAVEAGGGTVFRVRLIALPAVLLDRVGAASRRSKNAIRDPAALERQLRERSLFEYIAVEDLAVDTSAVDASDVAAQIWRDVQRA